MKTANCIFCSKEFRVGYDKRAAYKFCSQGCYYGYKRSNKKPNNTKCKACGKKFRVKPSALKRGEGKHCSTKCYQKTQREGKEMFHTSYYEHVALRSSSVYQKWRREALKLHDSKCNKCGVKNYTECKCCGNRISLHVNHVEPFSQNKKRRFDPTNSSILCPKCHRAHHNNGVNSVKLCEHCKKQIAGLPSYAGKRKFCSTQCYFEKLRQYRAKP